MKRAGALTPALKTSTLRAKHGRHETKKTRWVPYVEDPLSHAKETAFRAKIPRQPDNFKTPCVICGSAHAPFGVGYPQAQWFCRKHIGAHMPEVPENLDKQRLEQVRRKCPLGAKLWLDLMIAADNKDAEGCRQIWKRIRDVSIEASDILKALGAEKGNG